MGIIKKLLKKKKDIETGLQDFGYNLAKKKKEAETALQNRGRDIAEAWYKPKPTQAEIDEYGRRWRDKNSGRQL